MMSNVVLLIMSAWTFVCALFGLLYGFVRIFNKKSALYIRMIVCGVGCQMLSRLFGLIYILTQNERLPVFNVGLLGIAGSFLFFLSANFGQMDALVDDGSRELRTTRLYSLIVPTILLSIYFFFCLITKDTSAKIVLGILTILILPCSYYNFKHTIIYDVEGGIISQVRMYNILAVCYALLSILEFIFERTNLMVPYIFIMFAEGGVTAGLIPVLKKGADKWTRTV